MVSASKTNNYNIDDGQNGTPDNQRGQKIALFDVDGTLTPARQEIRPEMIQVLKNLRKKITIGVVGGSDLVKQKEQLGPETLSMYDYNFAENGVIAYKDGVLINSTSISDFLGEERIKIFINFCLHYIADLDLPIKRGTFIEFRTGMLNVSPIGRNCSKKERDEFEQYCLKHDIRKNFVKTLKEKFEPDYGLQYSIGGQISFDVFPKGWDKTYCLQFLNASESVNPKANSESESKSNFQEIHFFGDKTFEGGNDYEIFNDKRVIGHTVTSPEDTIKQLEDLFGNVNV